MQSNKKRLTAAGSLFTSCIQQVEPEGIKALRDAKARYYDALSQLRGKDGVLREAEAALKQAEAALKQAEAAHQQAVTDAYTKMQALERELKELEIAGKTMEMELRAAQIEAAIDALQKQMELANKQHEIDLINKQAAKAKAEEKLRVVLRDIALQAQDLTAAEKEAVIGAATAYLEIWEAVQDQKIKVKEAQWALDSIKNAVTLAKNNKDYAWDSETHSYQKLVDLYSRAIERAKGYIAEDEEALKNVPELPDVDAWNAELQAYQAAAGAAEYSRHELTQEAAAYYVTYVHDGVKAYNDAIDAWVDDNPAYGKPGDKPKYKEGQSVYTLLNDVKKNKIDDKAHQAGETFGAASTSKLVDLPELEYPNPLTPAFAKFDLLLDSYKSIVVDGSTVELYKDGVLTIDADMKDFILGDNEGTVDSQILTRYDENGNPYKAATASYGLWGAYSVLEREKVLYAEDLDDLETVKKQRDAAKKIWEEHRDTLKNGILAYEPYVTAMEKLADAKKNESNQGDAMVAAIEELIEALASVNSTDLSRNDSVRIVKAFASFAQAREDFLVYKNEKKADALRNYRYYYYGAGKKGGETVVDSVLFTKLTYDDLLKDKYGYTVADADKVYGGDDTKEYAIGHIARQLLNEDYGSEILKDPKNWNFAGCNLNSVIAGHNAFYGEYKYVPATSEDPAYMLELDPGVKYESKALKNARKAVTDAIGRYKVIYENFWAASWPCAITYESTEKEVKNQVKKELDVERYTEDTFMTPFNAVSFNDAGEIIFSKAIAAILGTVDNTTLPAGTSSDFGGKGTTDNTGSDLQKAGVVDKDKDLVFGSTSSASKLFNVDLFNDAKGKPAFDLNRTDFYNYMVAEYRVWLAENPADADLVVIKGWIEDVAAAIDAANEGNIALAKKAYEADLAVYEANKANYDKYLAALKEFTGTKSNGDPIGLKYITNSYVDVTSIQYKFQLIDVVNGKWISSLKGGQLELANKYFPEFPEKLNDWYERNEKITDDVDHAQILIAALKPAYFAAAKAAGYVAELEVDGTTFDDLMDAYKAARKAYVDALEADIEAQEAEIDKNMKLIADFESGAPALDILVAKAQADYDKEAKKLSTMEEVLKGARENLERILKYIETLGANFVIIPTDL